MKKLKLITKHECCSNVINVDEEDLTDHIGEVKEYMFFSTSGPFKNRAIVLDGDYDYVVGKNEDGSTILVPLKK